MKQPSFRTYFYEALEADYRVRIPTVSQFFPDTWRYFRVGRVRSSLTFLIITGRIKPR